VATILHDDSNASTAGNACVTLHKPGRWYLIKITASCLAFFRTAARRLTIVDFGASCLSVSLGVRSPVSTVGGSGFVPPRFLAGRRVHRRLAKY
jgi:hypothetical protein